MIKELYNKFVQFPFICTDTRRITPNCIFFCLKGNNYDGNLFANEAIEKGAKYVIAEKRRKGEKENEDRPKVEGSIIFVEDVLKTLQQLAHYHRRQLTIPIIGITGTNGKTTTKELIACVLSKKYKTASTQGNLNNHIGVPLTILSIKKEDEIAVIEMGANHVGEIEELCRIAEPEYGIITNIGKAHLEGFGSVENIIETKTALYKTARVLFVNVEDELLMKKVESMKAKIECYCNATITAMNPCLVIKLFGNTIQTQLTGNYNLPNILAAAKIGGFFGVTEKDVCDAIAEYVPQNLRSQIIKNKTNTIIADYYNANPSSMIAALENFLKIEVSNKLAILGDMLELGENTETEHQSIVNFCEEKKLQAFFVGAEFFKVRNNRSLFFMNMEDCNHELKNKNFQNTYILIKGSRGIRLENIVL